jgi:ABC-type dipeptide/oligopeptide/nickel transport system permease component
VRRESRLTHPCQGGLDDPLHHPTPATSYTAFFIVSLILFLLLYSIADPLTMMGGRNPTRPEDRARLARQLGLDQPIMMQYRLLAHRQ